MGTPNNKNTAITNLLDKGFDSLKSANWAEANSIFDEVIDKNAKEALAYFGKLMCDLKYCTEKDFETGKKDFSNNENYGKISKLSDDALKNKILSYNEQAIYNKAKDMLDSAADVNGILDAKQAFVKAGSYADAAAMANSCDQIIYNYSRDTVKENLDVINDAATLLNMYKFIGDTLEKIESHSNSADIIIKCKEVVSEYEEKIEKIISDHKEAKDKAEHEMYSQKNAEKAEINSLKEESSNLSLELAGVTAKFRISKLFTSNDSAEEKALKKQLDDIKQKIDELSKNGAEEKFKTEFLKLDIEKENALKNAYTEITENYDILGMFKN